MSVRELLDWETAAVLAALVLVDGLRALPVDSLVFRKVLGRPWTILPRPRGHSVVSWPAPFGLTVVVHRTTGDARPAGAEAAAEPFRPRRLVVVRLLGGATLTALVLGLPLASRWLGALGFLWSLAGVLMISGASAIAAIAVTRSPSGENAHRPWWALSILSPFGAPRGADICAERLLRHCSPLDVARQLLSPDAFRAWLRPRAFDRLQPDAPADPELDARFSHAQLLAMTRTAPAAGEDIQAFCPRCGIVYREASVRCSECDVPVREAH